MGVLLKEMWIGLVLEETVLQKKKPQMAKPAPHHTVEMA